MSNKSTKNRQAAKIRNTTYVPVSKNVYFDGTSYRVRVSIDGEKYSKNFSNKKQAVSYRNQLLSA